MNYFMINDQYIAFKIESILRNMHTGGRQGALDIKRLGSQAALDLRSA